MYLNCKGNLIDLNQPRVMGILNLTPDSFYDGGRYQEDKALLHQVEKMILEGADFIDLGGYSSRPGADEVSEEEELRRVLPAVELILQNFPEVLLSIDTFRSNVARNSLEMGAAMINDITAGSGDPEMMRSIAAFNCPYILMHMKGTPQTMQQLNAYDSLIEDLLYYFSAKLAGARKSGIKDLIVDPGFGFAKDLNQNYELLRGLNRFQTLGVPILAGLSRKSMIYKKLNTDASGALNGTTALHMVALEKGSSILRVHDVKEAVECVVLFEELR
ncbi:dihydropteroate synthase [Poritiphilus flavus]|uniref:Dihydropteroate synthase n=1 Tax=Poritiphilus flavus TaxID=2697053 RepID=A0A6L9E934_9FLAO|nr:dihydropteroate synthase [Poritiphilus flavus]NAS11112.1 dihydropteroate synthase [Poritiphilus flavus]